MRDSSVVSGGSVGSVAWVLGLALGAVVLAAGCGRSDGDGSGPIDTAAVTGDYAPLPGAVEAAAQPEMSRRYVHPLVRHVRHRHAGPR